MLNISSELMGLASLKRARSSERGISREDYWRSVQASLSRAAGLAPLLSDSGSSIEISQRGMLLNYPLTPEVNLSFIVNESDTRSIGVTVVSEGRYEPRLQNALLKVSEECGSFADIGANAGFYSIAVAATNPHCQVLAFECNPAIREIFEQNVQLNGLQNITIRSEALSDNSGEAIFYVPAFTGSGGGSLQDLHPEEGESQKFQVSMMPLDSLNLKRIDLMKIDVEGAELSVIRGGIDSISVSRPTIFIELLRKWMSPFGSSPQDVSELLTKLGYLIFEITEEQLREVSIVSDETSATNFVFVHESRTGHLSILRGLSEPK
jgi:FkbM family methyltransferase